MQIIGSSMFPLRRRVQKQAPVTACPPLPIAFTRDLALADWIQVFLGVGELSERQSVAAQVVFLGLDSEGQIGFVARDAKGTIYRGWEEPTLLPSGPCYAAVLTSTGSLVLPIAMHRGVFPLPFKARPFKRYTGRPERPGRR